MKKYIIIAGSIIVLIILFANSFKIFTFFFKPDFYTVNIYNESDDSVDSLSVKTCMSCKEFSFKKSNLKAHEFKKIKFNISDYKPKGKDNFFFIKIYMGNYYMVSTFNYHDSWGSTSSESNIYLYDNFISLEKLENFDKKDKSEKFKIK